MSHGRVEKYPCQTAIVLLIPCKTRCNGWPLLRVGTVFHVWPQRHKFLLHFGYPSVGLLVVITHQTGKEESCYAGASMAHTDEIKQPTLITIHMWERDMVQRYMCWKTRPIIARWIHVFCQTFFSWQRIHWKFGVATSQVDGWGSVHGPKICLKYYQFDFNPPDKYNVCTSFL